MGDVSEGNGQAPELETVERGRYRVLSGPDGLILMRATDLCDTCTACGCGDPAEPVELPDPRRGRLAMMQWFAAHANKGLLGALGKVMSDG